MEAMGMIIGRENELKTLNNIFKKNKFECLIMYGRRRVGKTTLINEFVKNKKNIFYAALSSNSYDNLKALSLELKKYLKQSDKSIYSDYEAILDTIYEISKKERVVFVIDEFPYLAESEKKFTSLLQHYIDKKFREIKLFIILCGSSMSFMEKKVLSEKSPLFGRRTAQIKIEPLDYKKTALFNKKISFENNALVYGITGGLPHYINELNVKNDIKNALLENFLNSSSYLFGEPENILMQELREPNNYNAIINQIANGATKLSEISNKARIDMPQCSKYINILIKLDILKKNYPIIGDSKKKSFYKLKDFLFRFWYYFVQPNMTLINSGRIKNAYNEVISSYISNYMGEIFEEICKQYLLYYDKKMPINILDIGEWWGYDKKNNKEIQIDIVATSPKKNNSNDISIIVGSCKWTNEKVGIAELNLLKEYTSVMLQTYKNSTDINVYYYLFSKSGFKSSILEYKENNVKLINLKDLYN